MAPTKMLSRNRAGDKVSRRVVHQKGMAPFCAFQSSKAAGGIGTFLQAPHTMEIGAWGATRARHGSDTAQTWPRHGNFTLK